MFFRDVLRMYDKCSTALKIDTASPGLVRLLNVVSLCAIRAVFTYAWTLPGSELLAAAAGVLDCDAILRAGINKVNNCQE